MSAAPWRPPAAWCSSASPTARWRAYDDTTLEELWKLNVGSGFNAPPMTFEVGGKQYVAIASGLYATGRRALVNSPEVKEQRNATVLYVFGL